MFIMTNTQLKSQIDSQITNETEESSVSTGDVGNNLKDVVDYVDQEVSNIPEGPQGAQGIQGIQGPVGPVGPAGLNWQGAWDANTSYSTDDAVGYDGASWFCISEVSGTGNPAPDADTTHWALLAAQGAQGETGAQGPPGPQGPPGTSGSSAVYKAILTQTGGTGVTANVITNTLGASIDYSTQSVGSYSITPDDFGNYSCHASNLSPTKTVKCSGYITGFSGVLKQFDLSGNPVANFNDIYIEIRPINA